jgi:hypothetical protein
LLLDLLERLKLGVREVQIGLDFIVVGPHVSGAPAAMRRLSQQTGREGSRQQGESLGHVVSPSLRLDQNLAGFASGVVPPVRPERLDGLEKIILRGMDRLSCRFVVSKQKFAVLDNGLEVRSRSSRGWPMPAGRRRLCRSAEAALTASHARSRRALPGPAPLSRATVQHGQQVAIKPRFGVPFEDHIRVVDEDDGRGIPFRGIEHLVDLFVKIARPGNHGSVHQKNLPFSR